MSKNFSWSKGGVIWDKDKENVFVELNLEERALGREHGKFGFGEAEAERLLL